MLRSVKLFEALLSVPLFALAIPQWIRAGRLRRDPSGRMSHAIRMEIGAGRTRAAFYVLLAAIMAQKGTGHHPVATFVLLSVAMITLIASLLLSLSARRRESTAHGFDEPNGSTA
jgi:hypothetical protein